MEHIKQGFDPTTWAVLQALRDGARISRNKHFGLFEDARVRRAFKVHRYLHSVVRDIQRHPDAIQVCPLADPEGESFNLKIEIPSIRGRRTAYLSGAELHLLAQDAPEIATLIEQLLIESAVTGAASSPADD